MNHLVDDYISEHLKLSDEERAFILDLNIIKSFKKGTVLLREGAYAQDEYFIFKGCLRSYYVIDGIEKTTEFYTELEPVSPVCVATREPSEYYIACLEDAILLVSNAEIENKAFDRFPQFERLCRINSEQLLAKKQAALHSFKTSSPEQRYSDLIATRPDLLQRVPQYQLASYLGITPQSLSRLRNRMGKK